MFVHIGNGISVREKEIIGIFDLDTASMSDDTKQFLRRAEQNKIMNNAAGMEIPRSFVLTSKKEKRQDKPKFGLSLSLISTGALKARAEHKDYHDEE